VAAGFSNGTASAGKATTMLIAMATAKNLYSFRDMVLLQ
jgi:hypothetical protein